jgi:hypothetical protein
LIAFVNIGFGWTYCPLPPFPRELKSLTYLEPVDDSAAAVGKEGLMLFSGTEDIKYAKPHGNEGDLEHILQILMQFFLMEELLKSITLGENAVSIGLPQDRSFRSRYQGQYHQEPAAEVKGLSEHFHAFQRVFDYIQNKSKVYDLRWGLGTIGPIHRVPCGNGVPHTLEPFHIISLPAAIVQESGLLREETVFQKGLYRPRQAGARNSGFVSGYNNGVMSGLVQGHAFAMD